MEECYGIGQCCGAVGAGLRCCERQCWGTVRGSVGVLWGAVL